MAEFVEEAKNNFPYPDVSKDAAVFGSFSKICDLDSRGRCISAPNQDTICFNQLPNNPMSKQLEKLLDPELWFFARQVLNFSIYL